MKAMILHHLGAPCVVKIRENNENTYSSEQKYSLNPVCLTRYEPGGAVLTPPMLYSSYLHVDTELMNWISQDCFSLQGFSEQTVQLLLENKVIIEGTTGKSKSRSINVDFPGLPTQVLLDVTSACNCHCDHCYHMDDLDGFSPNLSDILKRIKILKNLGIGLFEITGGEPLLRDDLSEILDSIAFEGLHYYVVTNGEFLRLASNSLIKSLQNGLGLAVSLDGVGVGHDKIRQRLGLYDKLIEGLDLAFSSRIPIYFIATINELNLNQIDAMIEVAIRYRTTLHLRPTISTGNAVKNAIARLDLRPHLTKYLNHQNVRNGLLSTKKTIPEARYYGCGLRKRISVSSKGILYPCVMDRSEILEPIENYDQRSLLNRLRIETKKYLGNSPACYQCKFNDGSDEDYHCGGFCRFAQSYRKEP